MSMLNVQFDIKYYIHDYDDECDKIIRGALAYCPKYMLEY